MSEDNAETQTEPPEPPAAPKKRRRVAWHGVRLLAILAIAPLIFALIAAVSLIDRDISAPSWIKSRVAESASDVMGGGDVAFGEIYINIGRDLHPRVRLRDTVVTDADGAVVARIADIAGLMSPRGLLFDRDVLMQDVILSGAQIDLRRNADGTVALAFAQNTAPVDQAGRFTELLDQADQVLEQPAFAALETIRAENLIIAYTDARAGRAWTVDGGRLDLDLRDGQTSLRADLALLAGRASVTAITATYVSPRGSRAATFGVSITDAVATDIASQSAALSWLAGFEAPLSATLRTTLNAAGKLGDLSATLEMGAGALQPNAATAPIAFDTAKAYLTFDPAAKRIQFDQIEVAGEMGAFLANGQALLSDDDDGLPQSMIGQFRFRDITLAPTALRPQPLDYANAQVDLRLGLTPFAVEIGQFYLEGDDMTVTGRGDILATPEGWQTAFDLTSDTIDQDAILSLWPQDPADWARAWTVENLAFGRIDRVQMALRQSPGNPMTVMGGFEFADTTMRPIPDMVPVTRAAGVIRFGHDQFSLSFDEGRMTPPDGGSLNIAGSTMVIADTTQDRPPVRLDLNFAGTITATMSLMDEPAFGYATAAGLPVAFASGRAQSNLVVNMPMDSNYAEGELKYRLRTTLRDFQTDYLVTGQRIAARSLDLRADNNVMTVSGPATVGGIPVSGTWTKPFDNSGDTSLSADVTLSPAFLAAFDIALPRGAVSGSGQGRLEIDIPWSGASRFTLTSRLQGIGVSIPALSWAKARASRGNLRIVGTLGDTPTIDRFTLAGNGLDLDGRIILNRDGSLDRAVFSQVRVGNWLNAPVTLRGRGGNRPYGVTLRGGSLDMRRADFGGGGGESGPMAVTLDRLQITEGIALTRFAGEFAGAGGLAGEFTALLNGAVPVAGTIAPQNGRSAVRLRSNDAGGVARAAGLLDNGIGGSLDLTLVPTGAEGTFDGTLAIRQIRVRDAPAMAALLDAVSVVGLLQQLDGQGLSFEEVDARFRLTPQQVILAEASAVGPGLGISLDGIYTLASERVDFQGVVSPFYLINAIGSVFTRRGEGLIGFNFNILGSAAAPEVSVNPLSAFTPGMFREIFRRAPPDISQ